MAYTNASCSACVFNSSTVDQVSRPVGHPQISSFQHSIMFMFMTIIVIGFVATVVVQHKSQLNALCDRHLLIIGLCCCVCDYIAVLYIVFV